MKRDELTHQLQDAEASLDHLRTLRERARVAGDTRQLGDLRTAIASATADVADIKAALAAADEHEASAQRQAELEAGRQSLASAGVTFEQARALWSDLEAALIAATSTARALSAAHARAQDHLRAALSTHFSGDSTGLIQRASVVSPFALGADGATVRALAVLVHDLVRALPGSLELQASYLLPNYHALTSAGAPPPPPLTVARQLADEQVQQRTADLCQPRKVAA